MGVNIMPDWKMHLRSTEKLFDKFKIDGASAFEIKNTEDFRIGVVLPDTPWIEYSPYNQTETLKYKLHRYIPRVGGNAIIPNYFKYLKEENDFIRKTDIGKGMLFHMILDAVVNEQFNQSIVEKSPGEFTVVLADCSKIEVSGMPNKVDLCYADLHSYEDCFSVNYIFDTRISEEATEYIWSLGCKWPIVDLVIEINNYTDKSYSTVNKIFTIKQYDGMIADAMEIFLNIAKAEEWK